MLGTPELKARVSRIQETIWYSILILLLATIAGGLVIYELTHRGELSEEFLARSEGIDFAIGLVFMTDFLLTIWIVPKKLVYLFSLSGFLNFLSSFPLEENGYRLLRLLRFTRGVRMAQAGLQSQQELAKQQELRQQRDKTTKLATIEREGRITNSA